MVLKEADQVQILYENIIFTLEPSIIIVSLFTLSPGKRVSRHCLVALVDVAL